MSKVYLLEETRLSSVLGNCIIIFSVVFIYSEQNAHVYHYISDHLFLTSLFGFKWFSPDDVTYRYTSKEILQ